jgi:NAD(P)-dependent dehydrogenase (short-subunit alcohol dehydrogenase family)
VEHQGAFYLLKTTFKNSGVELAICYMSAFIIYKQQLTSFSIGFGAAEAFLDAGAKVTVISSNEDRVKDAVKRLNSPNVSGLIRDVRDETAIIDVFKSLAPVDHVVFSGVDKIIRGDLAELNVDDAKHLFGVKFWGSVIIGKGKL